MPRQAVFFLIDTQGVNCVGCYAGRPELGTPNIDRLASEGLRFDRACTCSPVCGPARSAIFTGLYPHSNGVLGNNQSPHQDIPNLGQRLQAHGIAAGYVGKWHLDGLDYFGSGRCAPGWDPECWFDGRNYLDSLPDQAARDLSRRELSPEDVAALGVDAGFTHAHRSADRAIDFIRKHRHEDFLLVVSIDEPHHPYISPEPFCSAFAGFELPIGPAADDPLVSKPRQQQEWARHHEASALQHVRERGGEKFFHHPAYFGCNSFSDYEVGRVLSAIDAEVPRALTVYTADHGDMLFAHRLNGKGPAMYDDITRVPLIFRWPDRAPAGSILSHPVSHIDLVPTFLDYFGIDAPPLLQGRSLLPAAEKPAAAASHPQFIEFNRYEVDHDGFGAFAPIRCICDGRYKLSVNLLDTDELYDLQQDPAELLNRIGDPTIRDIRDDLHDRLLEWQNATRDPLRGPHWARREWREADGSTWGGPTRPRPNDRDFSPETRLYLTGRAPDADGR